MTTEFSYELSEQPYGPAFVLVVNAARFDAADAEGKTAEGHDLADEFTEIGAAAFGGEFDVIHGAETG